MKLLTIATAALALAALPALASEATFERTLAVSGHVELTVNTGSGNIHLTRGTSNVVHIVGHVRSDWGNYEDRVREIANNPPIEQTGNIIRIGGHHENLNHVSISYEIQAPEDSFLDAGSGSGNIEDDGVGENAKISTGSGNIHATGLRGNFSVGTGSGDVYAEQTGEGDVKAQTGSGTIELKDIHGGLRAGTGSGDIKVNGSPATDWKLETGSGSVELWPGSTGFTLDASTGSGSIHTDGEMTVQGSFDKHHITGKIRGGGPTVRADTGSGDIRIH
jgi:DUF4097 and DUF4098 domain-containing protein YvlB